MNRLSLWQKPSLFDSFFSDLDEARNWKLSLPVDIKELDDGYQFKFDIPGMSKEDIHIELKDSVLSVSGERKSEQESDKNGYHHVERSYGKFQRSFQLPSGADMEKVKAQYESGVLDIFIGKAKELKARKVELS